LANGRAMGSAAMEHPLDVRADSMRARKTIKNHQNSSLIRNLVPITTLDVVILAGELKELREWLAQLLNEDCQVGLSKTWKTVIRSRGGR
jgi:hypothetical protein